MADQHLPVHLHHPHRLQHQHHHHHHHHEHHHLQKPLRVHKRSISDQQKRRDIALERQRQSRRDLQNHARHVVSLFLCEEQHSITHEDERQFGFDTVKAESEFEHQNDTSRIFQDQELIGTGLHQEQEKEQLESEIQRLHIKEEVSKGNEEITGIPQAACLKGRKAQDWFKLQFTLPEWMVDVPSHLRRDWYVLARPAGDRCIVVSSSGRTVSRTRNGRVLHFFPSALPNGSRAHGIANNAHEFCILDCIFHKPDNTYYIIDMMCWRGYPLYDCTYEFRRFWIESKLAEVEALDHTSTYNRYNFSIVPAYECDVAGLQAAYSGPVPFERDGCLFFNRHAHYVLGVTPLAVLWKDSSCSRYYIDTDRNGNIPAHQQVVLELQEDGTVATSDDPPVILGNIPQYVREQNNQNLKPGTLLKFSIGDQGLTITNGLPVAADIHYEGLANRYRAGPDSVSKVLFQYAARHAPLSISDIFTAVAVPDDIDDSEMLDSV